MGRSNLAPHDAASLLTSLERYAPLHADTRTALLGLCRPVRLSKGAFYCAPGEEPKEFGYVLHGLLRGYVGDDHGAEYNKVFFDEGTFPGSMVALLRGLPSRVAIQALEPTRMISIDFTGYRALLRERPDLMWFQIRYLEENWLLAKEPREVALVQEDAASRYARFLRDAPRLAQRLPLYHVASHLGITPTQLSRLRRSLPTDAARDAMPVGERVAPGTAAGGATARAARGAGAQKKTRGSQPM
ncbi:MAG: Crp/Fnr family transcriptional regulator [Sandaracinaceae bacterium]|nr:Crp/Fnr family transcriptional regulator [Sandaracinaceae bacterium]